jgi:hypothetical protein
MKNFAWVGIAILLLLVIGANYPKFGGGLLVLLTVGMVYAAHERKLLS